MILLWIVGSTFIISFIAYAGIFSFAVRDELLDKVLLSLIGFAAGSLIGGAFLHLIPETIEKSTSMNVFLALLFGFVSFVFFEKFLWRHYHRGKLKTRPLAFLNLTGDGVHNFIDGLVMAASFLSSLHLGIVTSLAVGFHEVPQEIGDFGILLYSGLKKSRALILNFIAALTVVLGGVTGYFLSSYIGESMIFLLPFAAGNFIYIAASDLIPELHKEPDAKKSAISIAAFILGILFMYMIVD